MQRMQLDVPGVLTVVCDDAKSSGRSGNGNSQVAKCRYLCDGGGAAKV